MTAKEPDRPLEARRKKWYHLRMEQERTNKRTANVKTLLCVLTLAVLLLLLIWRVPFGYDWSDESDYLALPYRLLKFDRPLVDTWEVHQLSALITLPLVALHGALSGGSTSGILLFTRYCFVGVQFLAGVYAFFVLRRRSGDLAALFAAALLLGYAHFSINSLYYNSYALLFLALSVLLALDAASRETRRGWRYALSGLLFALSVQAQPYTLLAIVVWPFLFAPQMREKSAKNRRLVLLWLGGAALVALAFVAYVFARSPLNEIPGNVRGMLSDPSYPEISYFEQTMQYFNAIRVIFSPASYGAAVLVPIGIWYALTRNDRRKRALRIFGVAAALAVMAGAVAAASLRDWSDIYRLNTLAMAFSLAGPGLFLLNDRKTGAAAALFFFGAALSIATQFGSNTRILASSGMLVLGSMGTVLCLFDCLRDMAARETERSQAASTKLPRASAALLAAAVAVCLLGTGMLFWYRATAVHRDAALPELTRTIETGPAKGLRTTPEHAKRYEQLVSDIRALAPKQGNILVSNLFPDAYLLTDLVPAAPGEFNMSIEFISSYYELHPERLPDYIFEIDVSYGRENDQSRAITAAFLQNGRFEAHPLESGVAHLNTTE